MMGEFFVCMYVIEWVMLLFSAPTVCHFFGGKKVTKKPPNRCSVSATHLGRSSLKR